MYEKVNPSHPDKLADRIAGALVDIAYKYHENPKIAVEVLLGHNKCFIIIESNIVINELLIRNTVNRIVGKEVIDINIIQVNQDINLSKNQEEDIKCGDNGIFKGTVIIDEQQKLSKITHEIYEKIPYDGKYIIDGDDLIVCQSNATDKEIEEILKKYSFNKVYINPLGYWTGGINVDSGATNRKLGSDMGDSVTGGGLHGKDLSKADVTLNIYCFLKAQETGKDFTLKCAIGDEYIDGQKYSDLVNIAREYIIKLGGFEKFAEYGLIR